MLCGVFRFGAFIRQITGYELFPLPPLSLRLSPRSTDGRPLSSLLCELTSFLICCRAPHLTIALS